MKQNISKHRKTFGFLLLYVIITFLLLAISLKFDFTKIIAGGDTNPYLRPSLALHKSFFIWEDSVFGRMDINAYFRFFYVFPLFVLYQLLPWTIAQFVYWWLLFSLIPISFYLLSYYLTKNEDISFIAGLVYSWNLFTCIIIYHSPVYHMSYLYAVIPLLILLLLKSIRNNKKVFDTYSFFFVLLYLPLLRVLNMYLILGILIPLISYFILRYYFRVNLNLKNVFKKVSLIGFLILLFSFPSFITYVSYTTHIIKAPENVNFSLRSIVTSEKYACILNSMRFIGIYGWEMPWCWKEIDGIMQSSNAIIPYHRYWILIFLTFYPIFLALILYLITIYSKKTNRDEKIFFNILISFALFFLFLAKMINQPFGEINSFLYSNSTAFLILFRSAWKYMTILYIFMISLIISVGLNKIKQLLKKKAFVILLLVIFLIFIIYISPALLIFSKLVNMGWNVKIPNYYFEIGKSLNKENKEFRILPLPLTKHFAGYTPYDWNYTGPDLLESLLEKPMIDKYHNMVLSNCSLNAVDQIEYYSLNNFEKLLRLLRLLNVKDILIREDINMFHPYIKVHLFPLYYKLTLNNNANFERGKVFGNLTIYKLKNTCPRIYVLTNTTTISQYNKINNKTNFIKKENISFKKIKSVYFRSTFSLDSKNLTSKDWKIACHRILYSNVLKVSACPSFRKIYIFFFSQNGSIEKAIIIPFEFKKKDKIYLEIIYKNETLMVKIGSLFRFIEKNNLRLRKSINLVEIGGEVNSEKMLGNLYNFTLKINGKEIIDFRNISNKLKSKREKIIHYHCLTNITKFNKINPTLWKVRVNATKPFMLSFAESYDPLWEARIYKEGRLIQKVKPTPLYGVINGFWINQTGKLNITIRYKPQDWFDIGLIISLTTFALCIIYLIYEKHYKSKAQIKTNGKE